MASIRRSTAPAPARPRAGGRKSRQSKALRGHDRKPGKGKGNGLIRKPTAASDALSDVLEEVGDLAAILACVPELRFFSTTTHADRMNRAAVRLLGRPLPPPKRRGAGGAGGAFIAADLIDLGNAADTIIEAVKWRLERVKQLLTVIGAR